MLSSFCFSRSSTKAGRRTIDFRALTMNSSRGLGDLGFFYDVLLHVRFPLVDSDEVFGGIG